MSKTLFIVISIILILFAYIFNADRIVKNNLSAAQNYITDKYLDGVVFVSSSVNKYFNQLNYIDQLKVQNEEFQKYKSLYEITKNNIKELEKLNNLKYDNEHNLSKIKVLSYNNFLEKSIVTLEATDLAPNKITGLITFDGHSAGIVFKKENDTLAFLNENKKCNYAVFLGENEAPGITSGKTLNGDLEIDHIPLWKKIKEGDKVITSGMDGIFPHGVNVGEVIEVIKLDNTQKAFVKTYADTLSSRDYYLFLK